MKLKKKITKKQYLQYKAWSYVVVILLIMLSGYSTYQQWLNPLDLKPERDPKQHDGSQTFQRPIDFESTVEPAPDEDGTTRYLGPNDLKALDGLTTEGYEISPEDQKVLDELKEKPEYPHNILDEEL